MWKALLNGALSLALLVVLGVLFDGKSALAHVAAIPPGVLFGAALALTLSVPLQALRWAAVLRAAGFPLPPGRIARLVFVGQFFNQVLPSSIGGDAVRIWGSCRLGLPVSAAIVSVVGDRLVALLTILLMTAASLWHLTRIVPDRTSAAAIIAATAAGLLVFAVLFVLGWTWERWARYALASRLTPFVRALTAVGRSRTLVAAIAYSATSYVLLAAVLWSLFRASGFALEFLPCLLLVPPILLVTSLPISIAGWGVREGVMVVAFGWLGVPAPVALAVSVVFGLALAAAALPGAVLWWTTRSVRTGEASRASEPPTRL